MPISGKDFKADLAAGKPKFGMFLNSVSPMLAARFTHCGYDWLLIDAQHSPIDNATLLGLINAIHTGPARVMVRVAGTHDRSGIQQAADCGADGILIPYVNEAEELQKAADVCYFPPMGTRSVVNYSGEANENMLVAFQVETKACVDNIDAIMAVKGVHVAFVGPFDLCLSYGLHCQQDGTVAKQFNPREMFTTPTYYAALDKVDAAAKKDKVVLGIFLPDTSTVPEYLKRGYQFISLGADIVVAAIAANRQIDDVDRAAKAARLSWCRPKL